MRILTVLVALLLAGAGACRERGDTLRPEIIDDATVSPGHAPRASQVQLPDTLFLTVGTYVILLDLSTLFVYDGPLKYSGESSNVEVFTVTVWRRVPGERLRFTDQALIYAVGPGTGVMTLTAVEDWIGQQTSREAERTVAIKVSTTLPSATSQDAGGR